MLVTDFNFSRHALERLLDMDVRPDEVRECLESPTDIIESNRGDNRSMYYGRRITCIVNNESNDVVTVVWRTKEFWAEDILVNGEYDGRTYRG